MTRIRARHYQTLKPVEISLAGALIDAVDEIDCSEDELSSLPYLSPGFFDIQINGYNGIWFSSPDLTVEDVESVCRALVTTGVTRFFPTLITASQEALLHGFSVLRQAAEQSQLVADTVAGYHLEGPYIASEDGPRGAHPVQHVRAASYSEFRQLQEASGNRIRLVTLAAESENAVEFIQKVTAEGVVVALGHTGASPEQIRSAVDAGARLSTHFGNGAHGMLPRHPNYLWEQLAEDRLWASVIADGWHVPISLLRCVMKCKTQRHTILTCDVSGFGGCSPGVYNEGDVAVEVLDDGRIVVAGQRQYLAGSGALTGECVVKMAAACDLRLSDAVEMATDNPARLFGEILPNLESGASATFVLFDVAQADAKSWQTAAFLPQQTYLNGRLFTSRD